MLLDTIMLRRAAGLAGLMTLLAAPLPAAAQGAPIQEYQDGYYNLALINQRGAFGAVEVVQSGARNELYATQGSDSSYLGVFQGGPSNAVAAFQNGRYAAASVTQSSQAGAMNLHHRPSLRRYYTQDSYVTAYRSGAVRLLLVTAEPQAVGIMGRAH